MTPFINNFTPDPTRNQTAMDMIRLIADAVNQSYRKASHRAKQQEKKKKKNK
jgi:hypothetical protein